MSTSHLAQAFQFKVDSHAVSPAFVFGNRNVTLRLAPEALIRFKRNALPDGSACTRTMQRGERAISPRKASVGSAGEKNAKRPRRSSASQGACTCRRLSLQHLRDDDSREGGGNAFLFQTCLTRSFAFVRISQQAASMLRDSVEGRLFVTEV